MNGYNDINVFKRRIYMKIAITGGTGLIGGKLADKLHRDGHDILILTRNIKNKQNKERFHFVEWLTPTSSPVSMLQGTDIIVNLAGESIMGRWTKLKKERILSSRLEVTTELISIIKELEQKPEAFINASAIGYYGHSETAVFNEYDESMNPNFLSEVTKKWEKAASQAINLGIRTVYGRIGIVLDKKGGALPNMLLPYKFFVGGTVGTGRQWMSWIHIDDLIDLFTFAITEKSIEGPFNLTAPHPVRMQQLNRTIAKVLNRPHWIPAPSFAIKTALGEMSALVLEGAYVYPRKAMQKNFPFQYEDPESALTNLLQK